jgi:acyl-CoA synthetase (NDP forming)
MGGRRASGLAGSATMDALLRPASVAILGCSNDFDRISGRTLRYFLEKGYAGRLYPVNPKYPEIGGLRCYPDVASIPEAVDLAVVALPAAAVAEGLRQLAARRVPAAVIFSSGFAELGGEGVAAQRELARIARAGGTRFCGPNSVGIVNAFERVAASFSEYLEGDLPPGPVAFVSQSGAFGTAIAVLARQRRLGLGYFVNTGNEADLDVADALSFVVEDARIRVVAGYLEGVRDGRKLVAAAERAMALGKPMILTKVGRSDAGARAAASHTGALAGTDAVLDGVLRQKGVLRAENEEHMIDLVEAFVHCPLPRGSGLGIVSQSGGAGVLACDRAEALGLRVPVLGTDTQAGLRKVLPGYAAVANPVDVTGQSLADPELMRHAMKLVLADPAIDIGLLWVRLMDRHVDAMIDLIADIRRSTTKTFLVSWLAPPERALDALRERAICVARGAAQGAETLAGLARYAAARERRQASASPVAGTCPPLPARPGPVPMLEAAAILRAAGVPLVETEVARDAAAAAAVARRMGYPVVLKIESTDIPHKTEARGVRLNIADEDELRRAFAEIVAAARQFDAQARIDGVAVQRAVRAGTELVVGVHHDAAFGPVVMAGLGGILVEALQDVAFAVAPMSRAEAEAMLASLRGARVLDGIRGRPPVDRDALCDLLVGVSRLAAAAGSRLAELDLNPVIAGPDGVQAVDWLMVTGKDPETP